MKQFSFYGKFKYTVLISLVIILAGIISLLAFGGFNLGVDLAGGSVVTLHIGQDYDQQDIATVLEEYGVKDASIARIGAGAETKSVVRIPQLAAQTEQTALRNALVQAMRDKYDTFDASLMSIQSVSAAMSAEILGNAVLALVIALALMLIYIWIRFDMLSSIAAIVSLLLALLMMASFMAILQVPMNLSFFVALLVIIGFCANNTIVLFVRMRANKLHQTETEQLVDNSVREVLLRVLNTFVTAILIMAALCILGVTALQEFSLPVIIGLVFGAYASIFLVAPTWGKLELEYNQRLQARKQAYLDALKEEKK